MIFSVVEYSLLIANSLSAPSHIRIMWSLFLARGIVRTYHDLRTSQKNIYLRFAWRTIANKLFFLSISYKITNITEFKVITIMLFMKVERIWRICVDASVLIVISSSEMLNIKMESSK